jgi:hypothetical protein
VAVCIASWRAIDGLCGARVLRAKCRTVQHCARTQKSVDSHQLIHFLARRASKTRRASTIFAHTDPDVPRNASAGNRLLPGFPRWSSWWWKPDTEIACGVLKSRHRGHLHALTLLVALVRTLRDKRFC